MPTSPAERRLPVHILGVDDGTGVQQHLDGFFVAKSSGAMKRSFALGAHIAHESAGFDISLRSAIGIRAVGEEHLHYQVVRQARSGAQRGMKGSFAGVGQWTIRVRAAFQQKLAQPPVPMKASGVESVVVSQRVQRFAIGKQKFNRAHVTVISAPLNQRNAVGICRLRGVALRQI